jgi:hypothetical protein
MMAVGIDFDNTIVCYDELFHRLAVEQGLIPRTIPATKRAVRNFLERCGRGNAWTELQGRVYGLDLLKARAFPGVVDFFRACLCSGRTVYIISHKTRYPALGPPHDLHEAAHRWLEANGFYDPRQIGLSRDQVYFELTQQAKIERIAQTGCSFFIDDLLEILNHSGLPAHVQRILFDPHRQSGDNSSKNGHYPPGQLRHATSWKQVEQLIGCKLPS